MWVLIAQVSPSELSGWAGAGLLGLVLSWLLLTYLPAKDKQIRDMFADFREEMRLQRESAAALLKAERDLCHEDHLRLELSMKSLQDAVAQLIQRSK